MVEGTTTAGGAALPAVELRGITKRFGELVANDGVDFAVARGEVHALLGENGAGKSTLMRILYGLTRPDGGTILVDGRPVAIHSPKDAIAAGIGMVTQHFALVRPMTVTENVVLGATDGARVRLDVAARKVADAAERFGIRANPRGARRPPLRRRAAARRDPEGAHTATAASSSSTSRRRCSCRKRWTRCSRRCAASATTGWRLSSSATSCTRCARSARA